MSSQTPDLYEVIEEIHKHLVGCVFWAMPGIVTEYDATMQRVKVQPGVQLPFQDEEGNRLFDTLPIVGAPVVFPGSGGASITYPISVGDTGLLIVSTLDMSRWMATGVVNRPGTFARGHLSDCVFLPGLRPRTKRIKPPPPDDALCITPPTGGTVRLGSPSAAQAVVVQSALDHFMGALDSAITALGANPAAAALGALKTALTGWSAGTTKTKAS